MRLETWVEIYEFPLSAFRSPGCRGAGEAKIVECSGFGAKAKRDDLARATCNIPQPSKSRPYLELLCGGGASCAKEGVDCAVGPSRQQQMTTEPKVPKFKRCKISRQQLVVLMQNFGARRSDGPQHAFSTIGGTPCLKSSLRSLPQAHVLCHSHESMPDA